MNKKIIFLIGFGGSGKTSVAKHLEEKYDFTPFTFSSVIRDYAKANNITLNKRVDYANTHARMIEEFGWDYTLSIALGLDSERICIDDVRSGKYANIIREHGGKSIAFDCPTSVRFKHVNEHPDKAKYPDNIEDFIKNETDDEATSIGMGLAFETKSLMESADFHIDASGSLENTFRQVDAIVELLLGQN